jgi:hypothetical protein
MAKKRAKGGAFGGAKFKDTDGEKEPGTFRKLDKAAKVSELGTKTSSDGFKRGGAAHRKDGGMVGGSAPAPSLAKRARGGRTSAPFSSAGTMSSRTGSSTSGHECE